MTAHIINYTINYIIASFAAQNKRGYGHPEDTLKIHLRQLKELKHSLTQITLTKAETGDRPVYADYYDEALEAEMGLETHEVENQGYSNGQWLRGYERRKMDYDYYIFCEDDYCPTVHHFDGILLDLYRQKFEDNIGFLASLIQGSPKHPMCLPLHYEGLVVVSRPTLEKLYGKYPNPKQFLTWTQHPFANILPGGREQVNFTTLFRLCDIPILDTVGEYPFIYWNDCSKQDKYGGEVFFFNKPEEYSDIANKYLYENLNFVKPRKNLCIPIQFARTCVLVAGMHRSGTSAFSGSLNLAGLDYGKNKAKVVDQFNEHGYFENLSVLHFNEETLSSIGSSWADTVPVSETQVRLMLERKDKLVSLIRGQFTTNHFFIKDPRISLLLPLYISALKELCIQAVIVFIDRSNGSIAKSLQRAQGVIFDKGLQLCNKYKNSLLKFRGAHLLLKFDFDSFITRPAYFTQAVLDNCNRAQNLSPDQVDEINNFVSRKHVHF